MPEVKPSLWRSLTRGAILVGVLLVLAGLACYHIVGDATFFSLHVLAPFGVGVILLVASIGVNREWLLEWITSRRSFVGLNAWAMVVLSALLLVIANAIVAGTSKAALLFVDCTRTQRHTMPQTTEKILRRLKQPVTITVLMGDGIAAYRTGTRWREYDLRPDLMHTLDLLRAVSENIRVVFVNHKAETAKAEEIEIRINVSKLEANSIVVESGDRHERIASFGQLIRTKPELSLRIYEKLTEAILRVTEEKRSTVYFLAGHDELATSGGQSSALNVCVDRLKRYNYRVGTFDLLQQGKVPDDCDVLVIAGPRQTFEELEIKLLKDYLRDNGSLLALAFARENDGNAQGLNAVFAGFGVTVLDAYTVYDVTAVIAEEPKTKEKRAQYAPSRTFNAFLRFPHVIVRDLATLRCEVEDPCPLELRTEPGRTHKYLVSPLLASTRGSLAVNKEAGRDTAEEYKRGPHLLAAAIELPPQQRSAQSEPKPTQGPRLLVIGSPEIAMDQRMRKSSGNETFILNCINWLARREYKLGIPPVALDKPRIGLTEKTNKIVFYVSVVCLPLAAVLAGAFVFWVRRR